MIDQQDSRRACLARINPHLKQVETAILAEAAAFDPAVEGYVSYLLDTGGKRIRPSLALLAGGAVAGQPHEAHKRLGLILELIHIATLVHDDIMDEAEIRRQLPTASAKWGSSLAVLLGDCLFAHALQRASEFDDTRISRMITRAAKDVCTGEIIQTQRRFDLNLSKADYWRIVELKTAALFAAATEIAAVLSDASAEIVSLLRSYGLKLGIAYQLYDDALDLLGSEVETGKTLGSDLAKGKLTLPVIHLLETATDAQKAKLNRLIINRERLDTSILAGIADYEGSIERALDEGKTLIDEAIESVEKLPENVFRNGLIELGNYVRELMDGCRLSSY